MHAPIAKLAIDWLSVIPFTIHSVLQTALLPSASGPASIERCVSYSDIVNYITISRASLFFAKFFEAISRRSNVKFFFDRKIGDRETAITATRAARSHPAYLDSA
jgi:hypothetical protein